MACSSSKIFAAQAFSMNFCLQLLFSRSHLLDCVFFFLAPVGFFSPPHQDLLHHWHWSGPSEAQPAGGCDPFPHWRGAWPGMWVPGTKRALLGFSCTHHRGEGTVTNWLVSDWAPVAPAHTGRTKLKPRLIHTWKWAEVSLSCRHQRIFFFLHFKAVT